MNRIARLLDAAIELFDRVFAALAVGAFIAIIAVVLLQVVSRYALPQSPPWTEEASRYLFVYLVVLPSGLVIARNRHVRLELFHERLSPRWTAAYHVTVHVLVGTFAAYALPFSWQYASIGQMQTSPALGLPMVYVFASTVLFFALVVLYSIVGSVRAITALRSEALGDAVNAR